VDTQIREEGATMVPPGASLVWHGVRFPQHISDTLPAWSMHTRDRKDKFVEWLFDRDRRCSDGTKANSVCTSDYVGGSNVAVNPWLGGEFNPFERCDTERLLTQDGRVTNEAITLSCHPSICPNGVTDPYYANQPNQACYTRLGNLQTQVQESNVPRDFASNLCTKQSHNPTSCQWVQGMMQQGMYGRTPETLYEEPLPRHYDTAFGELERAFHLLASIEFWFMKLILIIFDTVKEIGNLVFRIIFDSGGFGSVVKEIIKVVCEIINIILDIWEYTGCWVLKNIVAPALTSFVNLAGRVIDFFNLNNAILGFVREILFEIHTMSCSHQLACDFQPNDIPDLADGANPVASRCWADYVPTIDDTDTFSCSRADTCKISTLQVGVTVVDF